MSKIHLSSFLFFFFGIVTANGYFFITDFIQKEKETTKFDHYDARKTIYLMGWSRNFDGIKQKVFILYHVNFIGGKIYEYFADSMEEVIKYLEKFEGENLYYNLLDQVDWDAQQEIEKNKLEILELCKNKGLKPFILSDGELQKWK